VSLGISRCLRSVISPHVAFDAAMMIPVAVVELNETHPAFRQPSCWKAIGGK
jgi:hypothetical protein